MRHLTGALLVAHFHYNSFLEPQLLLFHTCLRKLLFFFPSVSTLLNEGEMRSPWDPKNDEQRPSQRGASAHTMHRFVLPAEPGPGSLSDMINPL